MARAEVKIETFTRTVEVEETEEAVVLTLTREEALALRIATSRTVVRGSSPYVKLLYNISQALIHQASTTFAEAQERHPVKIGAPVSLDNLTGGN